jgi:hypothetical protein
MAMAAIEAVLALSAAINVASMSSGFNEIQSGRSSTAINPDWY